MIGDIQQRLARKLADWRVKRARILIRRYIELSDPLQMWLAVKEAKRLLLKAGWSDQEITLVIFGKWMDGAQASCSPSVALQS